MLFMEMLNSLISDQSITAVLPTWIKGRYLRVFKDDVFVTLNKFPDLGRNFLFTPSIPEMQSDEWILIPLECQPINPVVCINDQCNKIIAKIEQIVKEPSGEIR